MKVEEGGVHHKKYDGHCMNGDLKFQKLLKHHPFKGEGSHIEHPLIGHL
jgi:hypothetical protein